MEVKDLRVGNYIKGLDGLAHEVISIAPREVDSIGIFSDTTTTIVNPRSLESVPLTEEWLVRFGWDRESESISLPESDGLIISENNCTSVKLMDTAGNYLSKSITYVHELQNLYFGLTGEELEFKK